MNKTLRTILILLALGGLLAVGTTSLSGCSLFCDVAKYQKTVKPLLQEWDDAVKLANSTPRMSLPPQIEKMQSVRREVADLKIQSCLTDEHQLLLEAMDSQIDGFISFLAQDPDATVQGYFQRSDQLLSEWSDALAKK